MDYFPPTAEWQNVPFPVFIQYCLLWNLIISFPTSYTAPAKCWHWCWYLSLLFIVSIIREPAVGQVWGPNLMLEVTADTFPWKPVALETHSQGGCWRRWDRDTAQHEGLRDSLAQQWLLFLLFVISTFPPPDSAILWFFRMHFLFGLVGWHEHSVVAIWLEGLLSEGAWYLTPG